MPAIVKKMGKKYVVLSHKGRGARILGRHTTRPQAVAQRDAVNRSLRKRGKIK